MPHSFSTQPHPTRVVFERTTVQNTEVPGTLSQDKTQVFSWKFVAIGITLGVFFLIFAIVLVVLMKKRKAKTKR